MTYQTLLYDERDGAAIVTINRPEKNNAISVEMRHDFRALVDELYGNDAVRVVVFTGTGEIINAEEAHRIGLVNRVVDDERLTAEVGELAKRLAAKAPQALGIAKRVLLTSASVDLYSARTLESFGQSILVKTRDHREGVEAFTAKRRPTFKGD